MAPLIHSLDPHINISSLDIIVFYAIYIHACNSAKWFVSVTVIIVIPRCPSSHDAGLRQIDVVCVAGLTAL